MCCMSEWVDGPVKRPPLGLIHQSDRYSDGPNSQFVQQILSSPFFFFAQNVICKIVIRKCANSNLLKQIGQIQANLADGSDIFRGNNFFPLHPCAQHTFELCA